MVTGPAKVKITTGRAKCLGVTLTPGAEVVVRRGKNLPFECDEGPVKLVANLGSPSAELQVTDESLGTSAWQPLASRIVPEFKRGGSVLILGPVDAGKSTLVTFLANLSLKEGVSSYVLDLDVGQADLTPPGCIAYARFTRHIFDLRDLLYERFYFLGVTSPYGFENQLISETSKLMDQIPSDNAKLVNTDGFVEDEGLAYKLQLTANLQPSAVICIGADRLADELTKLDFNVMRLEPPPLPGKSASDRARRRIQMYRRFLRRRYVVSRKFGAFKYWLLGHPATASRINGDSITLGIESKDSVVTSATQMRGMFVALGRSDMASDFGLIREVRRSGEIVLETNVKDFDTIFLSRIRLDLDRGIESRIY
jgi:polynucleotide 5'-hydroxyl-kinase GRC3/NOL9